MKKAKSQYKWKPGTRISAKAEAVGAEIERLTEANKGRLESGMLVESARSKSSPLHRLFDWNDKTAGDSWRQEQAKYILRNIIIVRDTRTEKEPKFFRAFVSIERDEKRAYEPIGRVMEDPETREQILARALDEAEEWRDRYNQYLELAKVFGAIKETRSRLKRPPGASAAA